VHQPFVVGQGERLALLCVERGHAGIDVRALQAGVEQVLRFQLRVGLHLERFVFERTGRAPLAGT
jgi:hypothetical protein